MGVQDFSPFFRYCHPHVELAGQYPGRPNKSQIVDFARRFYEYRFASRLPDNYDGGRPDDSFLDVSP